MPRPQQDKDPRVHPLAERAGGIIRHNRMRRDEVNGPGEPKPRPERQGYKNHSWPELHLAVLYVTYETGIRGQKAVEYTDRFFPEIRKQYEEFTKRPMSKGALIQRAPRGDMYGEKEAYAHLLPEARKLIEATPYLEWKNYEP